MPEPTSPATPPTAASAPSLPAWAEEMRQVFRAGATSQFVLHGNVFDLVPAPGRAAAGRAGLSLARLPGRHHVPALRRRRPLRPRARRAVSSRPTRGKAGRLQGRRGGVPLPEGRRRVPRRPRAPSTPWPSNSRRLELRNQLPRDPKGALEIVDRILAFARQRTKVQDGKPVADPLKIAVLIDYAHYIAPAGVAPVYLGDLSQSIIQILDWSRTRP